MSCSIGYKIEAILYIVLSALAIVYFAIQVYNHKDDNHQVGEQESFVNKFRRAGVVAGIITLIMSIDSRGALNFYPWMVISMLRDVWTMHSLYHGSLYIVLNMQLSRLRVDEYSLRRFMFRFSTLPIIILFLIWCGTSIPSYVLDSSKLRGVYTAFLSVYLFLGWIVMVRVIVFITKAFIVRHQINQLHQRSPTSRSASSDGFHAKSRSPSSDGGISKPNQLNSTNLSSSEMKVLSKLAVISVCCLGMIIFSVATSVDFIGRPTKLSNKIKGARCERYMFFQFLLVPLSYLLVLFVYSFTGVKKDSSDEKKQSVNQNQSIQRKETT